MIAAALLLFAAPAPRSALVLPVNEDAAEAGALGHEIERKLRDAGVEVPVVVPAPGSVAELPAGDAATLEKTTKLFDGVEQAFSEARFDDALHALSQIAAMQETTHVRAADRVRLHLWRATVFLLRGDAKQAESAARDALVIAPGVDVDLRVFPPPLKTLVDRLKGAPAARARLAVTGIPERATVLVDDRPLDPNGVVPVGRHVLVVGAPGYRPVETRVDVNANTSVSLSLPRAMSTEERTDALEFLWRDGSAAGFSAALARARADTVVVADAHGATFRARIARASRAETAIEAPSAAALARAVAAALTPGASRAVAGGLPSLSSVAPGTFATAEVAGQSWTRTLSGGSTLTAPLGGAALRVRVGYERLQWVGIASGSWTTLAVAPLSVTLPDGRHSSLSADFTRVELAAGRRFGSTSSILLTLGGFFDTRSARDSTGLAMLPSRTWAGLALGADGRVPVGSSLALDGALAVAPFSAYRETPSGASGTSPHVGLAPSARLALEIGARPSRRLLVGAAYSRVDVSFQGRAQAPWDPPITNGSLVESALSGFVASEWHF